MTEPPPRKRFQIHLSTAIVLMFVAGGLIWLNTRRTHNVFKAHPSDIWVNYADWYGWPYIAMDVRSAFDESTGVFYTPRWRFYPTFGPLAADIAIALMLIFAAWFLCEWLIRRRAARKGA